VAGKPVAVPSGNRLCWGYVDDIVRGHILAMEKAIVGQRYMLAGPIHTLADALCTAARIAGTREPLVVPAAVIGGLAVVSAWLEYLNGIAATPDGRTLIVAHSINEALYTVDPLTGASELLVGGVGPDGILYEAGRLWVAEPFLNQVTRLRPNPDLTGAVVEEVITSGLFQTPTTVAVHGNQLAVVNAKFDTGFPPRADEYEVVLVER
jgi:hypothetical protein